MSRQAFEKWLRPKHADYDEVSSMLFEAWQAATAAALERAAEVCDAIAHDWRGANSQSLQCADAIRALKDADTCCPTP